MTYRIHLAGKPVVTPTRVRQCCAWCGTILVDAQRSGEEYDVFVEGAHVEYGRSGRGVPQAYEPRSMAAWAFHEDGLGPWGCMPSGPEFPPSRP